MRADRTPRIKDKVYVFNCLFLILPYIGLVILNFYWSVTQPIAALNPR